MAPYCHQRARGSCFCGAIRDLEDLLISGLSAVRRDVCPIEAKLGATDRICCNFDVWLNAGLCWAATRRNARGSAAPRLLRSGRPRRLSARRHRRSHGAGTRRSHSLRCGRGAEAQATSLGEIWATRVGGPGVSGRSPTLRSMSLRSARRKRGWRRGPVGCGAAGVSRRRGVLGVGR